MLSCLVDDWLATIGYLPKEPKMPLPVGPSHAATSGRVLAYRISHFRTRYCAAAVLVRRKPKQQVCQGELNGGERYEDSQSILLGSYEIMGYSVRSPRLSITKVEDRWAEAGEREEITFCNGR